MIRLSIDICYLTIIVVRHSTPCTKFGDLDKNGSQFRNMTLKDIHAPRRVRIGPNGIIVRPETDKFGVANLASVRTNTSGVRVEQKTVPLASYIDGPTQSPVKVASSVYYGSGSENSGVASNTGSVGSGYAASVSGSYNTGNSATTTPAQGNSESEYYYGEYDDQVDDGTAQGVSNSGQQQRAYQQQKGQTGASDAEYDDYYSDDDAVSPPTTAPSQRTSDPVINSWIKRYGERYGNSRTFSEGI